MLVNSPDEGSLLDGTKEHIEERPDNNCGNPERQEVYNEELGGSFWGENAFLCGFCHLILSL